MGKKNYGSVYGTPYQRYRYLLKYLDDYYKRKVKILIPNALDGRHILPSVRKGYEVDCYETNSKLLYGGEIDNFVTKGLYVKINCFNLTKHINVYEKPSMSMMLMKYMIVCKYLYLCVRDNKNIIVSLSDNNMINIVRKLSELITRTLLEKGLYPIHASSTVLDGKSSLYFGASGSGKSTMFFKNICLGDSLPQSNDITFVRYEEGILKFYSTGFEVSFSPLLVGEKQNKNNHKGYLSIL